MPAVRGLDMVVAGRDIAVAGRDMPVAGRDMDLPVAGRDADVPGRFVAAALGRAKGRETKAVGPVVLSSWGGLKLLMSPGA
mgnify:CR=1 FL=1